jgi:hypothetical protein
MVENEGVVCKTDLLVLRLVENRVYRRTVGKYKLYRTTDNLKIELGWAYWIEPACKQVDKASSDVTRSKKFEWTPITNSSNAVAIRKCSDLRRGDKERMSAKETNSKKGVEGSLSNTGSKKSEWTPATNSSNAVAIRKWGGEHKSTLSHLN